MKVLHVAAAVIRGTDRRILLARRPLDKHQGGLWEFPGGKVEAGEAVEQALARELHEELGIEVTQARPLIRVQHSYPERRVLLDVWEVTAFSGEPHGMEGQPLVWAAESELVNYQFPAANLPIVSAARLPAHYLITPDEADDARLLAGIEQALQSGIRLLQLRLPSRSEADYRRLAHQVLALCAGRAALLLKGPLEWMADYPQAGWHLTAAQLDELQGQVRPLSAGRWLAASCHSPAELAQASALGVDFVTLSPVLPTASHPDAAPLGWQQVRDWLDDCDRPAYLLGGLRPDDLTQAWQHGGQGIAAIRGLWPQD